MQLKTVYTAPWLHCPNKNVFSNCLNWPYDSPHSLRLGGRLFQTCGPAAVKVLSPKLLRVRLTTSVRVSAERSCLTVVGQVTWGVAGQGRVDESRNLEHDTLPHRKPVQLAAHCRREIYHIAWCPSRAWRKRSELTTGSASVCR